MTQAIEVQTSASDAVRYALKQEGVTVDQLEKLLLIEERYKAGLAKQAYHKAMTAFKENPPKIEKTKSVSFGQGKAAYKHATLYSVTEKINSALSKHGLSASWGVKQNGTVSVTTRITHELGHSEETTLSAPSDTSGSKNAIQAIGSTISYLERYGLLALCGLATMDQDDDGQAAVTEFISDKELSQLLDHLAAEGIDTIKTCEYLKVESLSKLPKSEFQKAMRLKKAAKPGAK